MDLWDGPVGLLTKRFTMFVRDFISDFGPKRKSTLSALSVHSAQQPSRSVSLNQGGIKRRGVGSRTQAKGDPQH